MAVGCSGVLEVRLLFSVTVLIVLSMGNVIGGQACTVSVCAALG